MNLDSSFFSKDEDSQRILFDENIFVNKADGKQKKKFNSKLIEITRQRFKKAEEVFKGFVSDLNISFGSIVICCGNHDALRLFPVSTNTVVCKKMSMMIGSIHYQLTFKMILLFLKNS